MTHKTYKRHNYLINKRFQLKYTLSVLAMLLVVMLVSGIGLYIGIWASIVENFSEFEVSQNMETAKRIAGYEEARYRSGDYRLEKIFREAELLSEQQRNTLKVALKAVNKSLIPKVGLLSLLIFAAGIFASHKIAGPMYRLEQSAEAIKAGNLKAHFGLRKGDELKKTASSLADMAESLRVDFEKLKKAKGNVEEIEKILSRYKT